MFYVYIATVVELACNGKLAYEIVNGRPKAALECTGVFLLVVWGQETKITLDERELEYLSYLCVHLREEVCVR